MKALALNLMIALIWMLLTGVTLASTVIGFVIGFAMFAIFPDVMQSKDYVRRTLAAVVFLGVFARAFLESSAQLLWLSIKPDLSTLQPRVITYDVRGLNRLEILLLSHCISLTPGTTTIDVSDDFSFLTLHVLDAPDPAAVRRGIDSTLKRGILAFTR